MSGGSLEYLYCRIDDAAERVASVYAERMEWLFSGDDGEESFLRRLTEDLEKLKKEGKI